MAATASTTTAPAVQPPEDQQTLNKHTSHDHSQHEDALHEQNSSKSSPQGETRQDSNRLPDTYFEGDLIQRDNTGTPKYKNLLRGLKNVINKNYSPSDNPDLMPEQLARFYGDLNGDYNELYLRTPSPSIAFIYKSLGCAYSLQPIPRAEKVGEPEVPALKTEGWIIWSTVQMLLGPDEHAGFLMSAVKRWDVIDPDTGKIFPKELPRKSFPARADPRMIEWYEGVSDRLKKEAEEEAEERERQKVIEEHAQHRRIAFRREDEEDSVDSRGAAMAYFRDPLYRRDGHPSIVRKNERRPGLSPRQSIVEKGKEAASTVGHVIRNVTSPHLWDGNSNGGSRERRRRSVNEARYHHPSEPPPAGVPYDDRLPGPHGSPRMRKPRRTSDRESLDDGSGDSDERPSAHGSHGSSHRTHRDDGAPQIRHSRSHEPTPSQRDYDDYFQTEEIPLQHRHRRSSSAYDNAPRPPTIGPSFEPSSGVPLAVQMGRQRAEEQRRRAPATRQDPPYSSMDRRGKHENAGYDAPPRQGSRQRHDDQERHRGDDHRGERPPTHDRRRQDDFRGEPMDRQRSHESRNSKDYSRHRSASGRRSSDMDSGYGPPDDRNQQKKQARFAPAPISGVAGRKYVNESPWQT